MEGGKPKTRHVPEDSNPHTRFQLVEVSECSTFAFDPHSQSGKQDSPNFISGYSSVILFGGRPQSQGPNRIPGPPSRVNDDEETKFDDVDGDAQSSDSTRRNTLSDSLRALPDQISRMEEQ